MTYSLKATEWNLSYQQGDNFVFYPHEEIIRFFARYIVKRTGIAAYTPQHGLSYQPKV